MLLPRAETFWEELVCLLYEPLLPFLTFVNCEGPYLVEEFLYNPCPCSHIVFVQLGAITRTRNRFVQTVAS